VNSNCLALLLTEDVKKDVHMDKVVDMRPTAELWYHDAVLFRPPADICI
jgi:hypothetical protein